MQFEEQTAAIRQMKELLRDQSKFRAKLDRVVRKIETSSERTAKLAERNKARAQKMKENGHHRKSNHTHAHEHGVDGESESADHQELTSAPAAS